MDLEKFIGEEVLYSGIQIAMSQSEFQKEADDIVALTNLVEKPTAFRTYEFESSKRCIRLGRGDQAGNKVDNFCNFHTHTRKKAYDDLGRGEQQRAVRRIRLPGESLSLLSHCRKTTTQRLPSHEERDVETRPTERKRKFLPQIGWPTRFPSARIESATASIQNVESTTAWIQNVESATAWIQNSHA